MNGPQAISFAFPKPRRALWIVLVAMTALGMFTAFLGTWVPGGHLVFKRLGYEPGQTLTQPWGLLTSGVLTSPESWSHLLFSLLGLYFLGAPMEARWGSWRFARFLALAVLAGNLTVLAVSHLVPPGAQERFHPDFVFGPTAAIVAVAVAWSREYAQSTVNLFFFLPVRGRVLFWITLGFCVLDLIYPQAMPEGAVAPFGGVLAGLLFAGAQGLAPGPTRPPAAQLHGHPRGGPALHQAQAPPASRCASAARRARGPRRGAEEAHTPQGQAVPQLAQTFSTKESRCRTPRGSAPSP